MKPSVEISIAHIPSLYLEYMDVVSIQHLLDIVAINTASIHN